MPTPSGRTPGYVAYNPDLFEAEELVHIFVARDGLLAQILSDLSAMSATAEPSHVLLVGPRGMGKTTFLRRLAVAVQDDATLQSRWLPLVFPEEQYNVSRLSDLWLNCLDSLVDSLEKAGDRDAAALDLKRDRLPRGDEGLLADQALALLRGSMGGRRALLLLDNLSVILDRLPHQHHQIQQAFSGPGAPMLVGASPALPDAVTEDPGWNANLRVVNLDPLNRDQAWQMLDRLSELQNTPHVMRTLRADPGRFKTLHLLTGGSPRTLVLLYGVLASSDEDRIARDVERLLDQCTPYYKARFEELSASLQVVMDALALRWDPTGAGALAEDLNMDVNSVSAALNRLTGMGVVERVPLPNTHHHGFQIAERFFNIWYLMRSSRRVRRRLRWLVEYLRAFYGTQGMTDRVEQMFARARVEEGLRALDPELVLAFAEATPSQAQRSALLRMGADLSAGEGQAPRAAARSGHDNDPDFASVLAQKAALRALREEVFSLNISLPETVTLEMLWVMIVLSPQPVAHKHVFVRMLSTLSAETLGLLLAFLDANLSALQHLHGEESTQCLWKAMNSGDMEHQADIQGASAFETRTAERGAAKVARLNAWFNDPKTDEAETLLELLSVEGTPLERLLWARRAAHIPGRREQAQKVVDQAWSEIPTGQEYIAANIQLQYLYPARILMPVAVESILRRAGAGTHEEPAMPLLLAETMLMDRARAPEAILLLEQSLAKCSGTAHLLPHELLDSPLVQTWTEELLSLHRTVRRAAHVDLALIYIRDVLTHDRAKEHLQEILNDDPRFVLSHVLLAALADDPSGREAHLGLVDINALAYIESDWLYQWFDGHLTRLEYTLHALSIRAPESALAPYMHYQFLARQRRWEEAEVPLREAIARDPSAWDRRVALSQLLVYQLKRPMEAIPLLDDCLRERPVDADASEVLADALERVGRTKSAAKTVERALLSHPNHIGLWKTLAYLSGVSKRRQREAVEHMVALDPDDGAARRLLALHLLVAAPRGGTSHLADVEMHLRSALRTRSDDDTLALLIQVLGLRRDWAGLIEEIRVVLTRQEPIGVELTAEIQDQLVELCSQGHASAGRALLGDTGWDERWRPLSLAMDAFLVKDPALLLGVAPEFRAPAEEVLERIWPEAERAPPPPRKQRGHARKQR